MKILIKIIEITNLNQIKNSLKIFKICVLKLMFIDIKYIDSKFEFEILKFKII